MQASRLDMITQGLSKRPNEAQTLLDWGRGDCKHVYINAKRVFSEEVKLTLTTNATDSKHALNKEIIEGAIKGNFSKIDQRILDYILKYGHQNDFLNASMTATHAVCATKLKQIKTSNRRYHFIENDDGSVTYVERFYIDSYRDLKTNNFVGEPIKSTTDKRPIAIVVTESIIRIKENQIQHVLASDKILLVDPLAENLFSENDGVLIKKYQTPVKQIETELNEEIVNYDIRLQSHIQFAVSKYDANSREAQEINKLLLTLSRFSQNLYALRRQLATHHCNQLVAEEQDKLCLEIDIFLKIISKHLDIAKHKAENSPGALLLELRKISSRASKFKNTKLPEAIRSEVVEPYIPELRFADLLDKHYKAVVATTGMFAVGGMGIGTGFGLILSVPTAGLSLLVTPALAIAGFILGAAIGFCAGVIGSLCKDKHDKQQRKEQEKLIKANARLEHFKQSTNIKAMTELKVNLEAIRKSATEEKDKETIVKMSPKLERLYRDSEKKPIERLPYKKLKEFKNDLSFFAARLPKRTSPGVEEPILMDQTNPSNVSI